MFLADAVANYVECLTERQLDAPLIALLHREGYKNVHLVHGQYEFGKDLIARTFEGSALTQCCLQTKAGDIGLAEWRAVRPQIDEMRTGSVVHPSFDPSLPRRLILVTNGRLTGGAPISIQVYNSYHKERNEAPVEIWTAEDLVPRFERFLVEGVPARDRARTLELLGKLGSGRGTRIDIATYAVEWNASDLSRAERWGHRLTAAMLAREAAAAGREDLANQLAFQLIASSWYSAPSADRTSELRFAHQLFLSHALEFFEIVRNSSLISLTLGGPSPLVSFVTHPVKAARAAEALSLLGLIAIQHGENDRVDEIVSVVSDLVEATAGVAHVVSDEWAFSVMIAAVLLAARGKLPVARKLLREAAVWTLDKIEFGDGIAQQGDDIATVTARLLGPPYPALRIGADRSAYVFSVILDIAHLLGMSDLFDDLLNDIDAVGGLARLVYDDGEARPQLIARVEYSSSSRPATHHHIPSNSTPPGAEREWFDCVAIWATVRDRHVPAVISELLDLRGR